MKITADSNVFLAVVMHEPERGRIQELTVGQDLLAPEVLPYEIGNALTAMLKKHVLSPEELLSSWDAVQAIPVELCEVDIPAALELARRLNLYAYDAYFIECAFRARGPLLTLDRRLQTAAEEVGVPVLK